MSEPGVTADSKNTNTDQTTGSCRCGKASFTLHGQPIIRAYCHCTICQNYHQAPFADVTVFHPRDVTMPAAGLVEYRAHQFPPLLQRGLCTDCQRPAIESLHLPFLKLIFVPTYTIADQSLCPSPALHIFYNSRVADIDDDLPKHSGYLPSQWAIAKQLLPRLRAHR